MGKPRWVDPTATVDRESILGEGSVIGPGVRILGKVELAEGSRIDANAVIYGPTVIGRKSYVGPNSVLGFPTKEELRELILSGGLRDSDIKTGETVVGEGCVIRAGCSIYSNVRLGRHVSLGHSVLIREEVKVGDETLIGTNVVVDGSCVIGKHVSIQTGAYICTNSLIEDYAFLGPYCVLTNDKYLMQKETELAGPIIKRGASIGSNALIMPKVVVGEGAIVGAQALVIEDVPPRTIVAGVPAKPLKPVPEGWKPILLERCEAEGCHRKERINR